MRRSTSVFPFCLGMIVASAIAFVLYTYRDQNVVKPWVLFHGSGNKNIEVLEPKAIHTRSRGEGAVVFASPSLAIASCFMARWDDSWCHLGNSNGYLTYFVCSDKGRFSAADQGGAIYLLDGKGFNTSRHGLGFFEWFTSSSIKPFSKLIFKSCVDAMVFYGVQVFFVAQDQFDRFNELSKRIQQEKRAGRRDVVKLLGEERKHLMDSWEAENTKKGCLRIPFDYVELQP